MAKHLKSNGLIRVGALAKRVGKSVRALHLYEEMGLLEPASRSSGGFRLYDDSSEARIRWILKLQDIGFSLTEIQEFIEHFGTAGSGRAATSRVREVFSEKLEEIREQMERLASVQKDVVDALAYLESCETCATSRAPDECRTCSHQGHEVGAAPELFAGLSKSVGESTPEFDVDISKIRVRDGGAQA